MNNADQPINPQNYTRIGDGENDFAPLIDGKKTGYEMKMGGLTKREYFAGLAMQGLSVGKRTADLKQGECYDIAECAIIIADELLRQLETTKQ